MYIQFSPFFLLDTNSYILSFCNPVLFQSLQSAVSNASKWSCELKCTGFSKQDPDIIKEYNICQFLSDPTEERMTNNNDTYSTLLQYKDSHFKFDPQIFFGTDARNSIKTYMIDVCKKAGFKIECRVQLNKPRKNYANPSKSCKIKFKCAHNKEPLSEMPTKDHGKRII